MTALALLPVSAVPFFGEEMFERSQQKGAELSFAAELADEFVFHEPREKLLRQVLGVLCAAALAADISVKRIPVSAAERFQRSLRVGRSAVGSVEHDAAVGRGKGRVRSGVVWLWQDIVHKSGRAIHFEKAHVIVIEIFRYAKYGIVSGPCGSTAMRASPFNDLADSMTAPA